MRARARISPLALAGALALLAAGASAADAPAPEPVVDLAVSVAPGRAPIPMGTPLKLTIDARFASEPAGGNFVLERIEHRFGRGAKVNQGLFPTCSAERLRAARGRLSACPRGSRIGGGWAIGRAVAVGVTGRASIALFNGPDGSLTMNVSLINPAYINETLSLLLVHLRGSGRYEWRLASTLPEEFRTILDGDIVVTRLHVSAGATRVVDGVRRGLLEAKRCPRGGFPIHVDYTFSRDRTVSADDTVAC